MGAVESARGQLPRRESHSRCEECGDPIPEGRRTIPGVRLCVPRQSEHDAEQAATAHYNRRASKDSQLP